MRKLSRMISPKLRRRTNGWPICAGNGGGPNNSGMVLAVVQTPSDSRRTSFVGSKRPSRFQSPSVSSSTGPYSFSPTRTTHRSAIARLIAKPQFCHPERKRQSGRSEEHTSELQSRFDIVCRLLLEKKKQSSRHGSGRDQHYVSRQPESLGLPL